MAEHTVDLRGLWTDWGDQNSDAGTPGDEALGTAIRRVTRVADPAICSDLHSGGCQDPSCPPCVEPSLSSTGGLPGPGE